MTERNSGTEKNPVLDRTHGLLEYLSAVAREVGPKPVRDVNRYDFTLWPDEVSDHSSIKVGPSEGRQTWLEVRRVPEPPPARIPDELRSLLQNPSSLTSPETSPLLNPVVVQTKVERQVLEELGDRAPNEEHDEEWTTRRDVRRREITQGIEGKFEKWVTEVWHPWAKKTLPPFRARQLYTRLYDLHLKAEAESATHEIVWGWLVLVWEGPQERVIAPLLTAPVSLQINPQTGAISVEPEKPVELELDALEGAKLQGLDQLTALESVFRDSPPNVWDGGDRHDVRVQLVAPLGVDAGLVDSDMPSAPTGGPRVNDGWVLFKRKRPLRQERFYDELADKIYEESFVPEALASVVSDEDQVDESLRYLGREVERNDGTADRLLMPLPANDEQERIVHQLARSRGVTVQGPPGTGKSHTIVNLISHLVAQGKRILVTAEKEQALSVLRNKIPVELRDLSLAVLGSTPDAMEELRNAVQSMQDSLSSIDVKREEQRIAELGEQVDALRRSLTLTDKKLVEALASEQREYETPQGFKRAPELAQWLSEHRDIDVITDAVAVDAGKIPLSAGEFTDFVSALQSVSAEDREASIRELPEFTDLPSGDNLRRRFARLNELREKVTALEDGGLRIEKLDQYSAEELRDLAGEVRQHAGTLRDLSGQWEDLLADAIRSNNGSPQWTIDQNKNVIERFDEMRSLADRLAAHVVEVPEGDPNTQLGFLKEWGPRVSAGKKLSMFAPKALKDFATAVRVDGYPVTMQEQLELVQAQIQLNTELREAHTVMTRAYAPFSIPVPELGHGFRLQAERTAQRIKQVVELWSTHYRAMADKLDGLTAIRDVAHNHKELERISQLIGDSALRLEERRLHAELQSLQDLVRERSTREAASPIWKELLDSLELGQSERWGEALEEVRRLLIIRTKVLRIQEQREKIADAGAPIWIRKVMQSSADPVIAGEVQNVELAWELAKARTWIRGLHGLVDVDDLMTRSHEESLRLQRTIVELASRSARVELKKNMRDKQRRALETWLSAVKKAGKGTGKNAPRFQAAARDALPRAMGAVPIWIMPIYRVMENFDPRVSEMFDVVVVDESSQADLLSLGVLALGKKAVIVGDDKQTTPERVGTKIDNISALQDLHLKGLPRAEAQLLTIDESLYSISGRAFPSTIALKEHFRCVPEIINFSNRYYSHGILPLREVGVPEIGEPLRAVHLPDAISEKVKTHRVNRDEANAIAEQIALCVEDPAYDGLTFGVVSMMSGPQSNVLQDALRTKIGDEEFEKRRLRVGNPPDFQGDERNVMFVSMVAHDASFAATGTRYLQWANVAASRAQDQLWVYYSMDPTTLNHNDQRRLMIEYVEGHRRKELSKDLYDLTDSKFERDVLTQMLERGYKVRPQHQVGSYRIDFVVEVSEGERLAVECDGDSFHGPDKWDDDVRRQRVLERLGWTFWRIRASAYYLDPEGSMEPLWKRLEAMRERVSRQEEVAKTRQKEIDDDRMKALQDEAAEESSRTESVDKETAPREFAVSSHGSAASNYSAPAIERVPGAPAAQHSAIVEPAGSGESTADSGATVPPNSAAPTLDVGPVSKFAQQPEDVKPAALMEPNVSPEEKVPPHGSAPEVTASASAVKSQEPVEAEEPSLRDSGMQSRNQASMGSHEPEYELSVASPRTKMPETPKPSAKKQTSTDRGQHGNAKHRGVDASTIQPTKTPKPVETRFEGPVKRVVKLKVKPVISSRKEGVLPTRNDDALPTQDKLQNIWKASKPYVLEVSGEILDGRNGLRLRETVGLAKSIEVRDMMRSVRPHGGRFRVDSQGRMYTILDRKYVLVGVVPRSHWFPGHWEK